jgi:hypothetical protein
MSLPVETLPRPPAGRHRHGTWTEIPHNGSTIAANMYVVIPNRLWIGNARDARDLQSVVDTGIAAIIDLAIEEPPIACSRDIIYCRFPLLDGAGNSRALLQSAVQTTAHFIHAEIPTLVACSGGMSRSPAIVAAAIARRQLLPFAEGLRQVAQSGPHDVSPGLCEDIALATSPDQHTDPPDGDAVGQHVAGIIMNIYRRPHMYAPSWAEHEAFALALHLLHHVWGMAVNRESDLSASLVRILAEESMTVTTSDRECVLRRNPDATDEDVTAFVLAFWRRISLDLGMSDAEGDGG